MTKTLKVIDPFFTAELGDKFELTEDKNFYSLDKNEEFYKFNDGSSNEIKASCSSNFRISSDYAKSLIEDGYLEEEKEDTKENKPFVNVFDEIDGLIKKYTEEISNIEKDMKDAPACLKVEKETVLSNIVKVLNYLKDLKK